MKTMKYRGWDVWVFEQSAFWFAFSPDVVEVACSPDESVAIVKLKEIIDRISDEQNSDIERN